MIKYCILASGCTGNSIFVGASGINLLVDAGISGRKIEESLEKIEVNIKDISGVFVTHEHYDHIKGLGVLSRKYRIPIYLNHNTFINLPKCVGDIDESLINIINTGVVNDLGGLLIESFGVSHDAIEPVGYTFKVNNLKLSIVTDLGYVSQKIKDKIIGSNVFIFEANHNIDMVRMSSYPWSIKQRILSDVGHLSNEATGDALVDVITSETEIIYLCNLSKENNMRELAKLTVMNILNDHNITDEKVKIRDTYSDEPTKLEILVTRKQILEA